LYIAQGSLSIGHLTQQHRPTIAETRHEVTELMAGIGLGEWSGTRGHGVAGEPVGGLALVEGGQVTAGNSSPLTSGAGAALVMSEPAMVRHGLAPLARVVEVVDCGVMPERMGVGAAAAITRMLDKTGLKSDDIDLWEINEAFSAVPLYAMGSLGIDPERVNVCGGALALGHPLGATGIRLAGTLARTLQHREGRFGCAAACIGGGQGIAMILERC
jgi:acetyl-CoA C-acetyltransferase